jgi:hypothetical protein
MQFSKLVPNIFYANIQNGIVFFTESLGFIITHHVLDIANPFCVLKKEDLRINLFQNEQLAKEHNPQFRLVTQNIKLGVI